MFQMVFAYTSSFSAYHTTYTANNPIEKHIRNTKVLDTYLIISKLSNSVFRTRNKQICCKYRRKE